MRRYRALGTTVIDRERCRVRAQPGGREVVFAARVGDSDGSRPRTRHLPQEREDSGPGCSNSRQVDARRYRVERIARVRGP